MAHYKLADGSVVEGPLNPTKEELAWLQSQGAQFDGDVIKSAGSKLLEGAARAPFLLSDLLNFGLDFAQEKIVNPDTPVGQAMQSEEYQDFRKAHKGSGWVDEALKAGGLEFYKPKTTAGKIVGGIAEGAGSGLASGVGLTSRALRPTIKATLPALVATGAASGGAAQVAGVASDDNPAAMLVAGFAGGLGANHLLRPSNAHQRLHDATRSLRPEDFQAARRNLGLFDDIGAQTHTLGETFPGEHGLLGLTREVSREPGGMLLARRMAGREDDVQRLAEQALDSVGSPVNAQRVAVDARAAAGNRLKDFANARSQQFAKHIRDAEDLSPEAVQAIYADLRKLAQQEPSLERAKAYTEIAKVLRAPRRGFKTDLRALSTDLKALKEDLTTRNPGTAAKVNANVFNSAYDYLDQRLRGLSPEGYGRANERYAQFSRLLNNPAEQGPLGAVAGRGLDPKTPASPALLENLIRGQAPNEVEQVIASLSKGANASGPDISNKIARALLQQRVRKGPQNPAQALRGMEGSDESAAVEALIRAGKGDVSKFRKNLHGVDLLSRTSSAADELGARSSPVQLQQNTISTVLGPFATGMRVFGYKTQQQAYTDIAKMLSNPTPENLQKLEQIAQVEPRVRRLMSYGVIGRTSAEGAME